MKETRKRQAVERRKREEWTKAIRSVTMDLDSGNLDGNLEQEGEEKKMSN